MVRMLVRDQHRRDLIHTLAHFLQTLERLPPGKPGVHQDSRCAAGDSAQFPRLPLASTDTDTDIRINVRAPAVDWECIFSYPAPSLKRLGLAPPPASLATRRPSLLLRK